VKMLDGSGPGARLLMTKRNCSRLRLSTARPWWRSDHRAIRRNYANFGAFARVQAYYAVEGQPGARRSCAPCTGRRQFRRRLASEFLLVHRNIEASRQERQPSSGTRYLRQPIKPKETLQALDQYKPLIVYDNPDELRKIKRYAPHAGLCCGCACPTPAHGGAVFEVRLRSGRGGRPDRGGLPHRPGGGGLSFTWEPVRQFRQLRASPEHRRGGAAGALARATRSKILDIGGGFPVAYDAA